MAAADWALTGAALHAEDGVRRDAVLSIAGSSIGDISAARSTDTTARRLPPDWHIVPGFIDSHIHGAAGADVMDANAAGLHVISRYLPREGTTSFLATTMTASAARIRAALAVVGGFAAPDDGADLLGVHLEGPFISPDKPGAQPAASIIAPDVALFDEWQALCNERIKVVTLAPEIDGAGALIERLRALGIQPSIGHSNCAAATAARALRDGERGGRATHLFNAMSGLHHRAPGAACAVLVDARCRAEIIADGVHVAPAMLALAYRVKTARGLIAVTDAMRAKGLGDGVFELGGQRVTVADGVARLDDGTLAGSVLALDQGLRNLIDACGCTLDEALAMASVNPAVDLGVIARKGTLAPGKDADIAVLDADLNVRLTVCRGRIVFAAAGGLER